MASLSDCLKIVEGFDEQEIAALEKRARKAAGTAKFTNEHFRVAAENMLGEAELEFNTLKRLGDERRTQLGIQRRERQFEVQVSQNFNPREQRVGLLRFKRNKEEWGNVSLRRLTALDDEVAKHPELEGAVMLTNPVGETILDDTVAWAERQNVPLVVRRPGNGAMQQEYIRRGFVPQGDYLVRTTEKVAARDAAREQKADLPEHAPKMFGPTVETEADRTGGEDEMIDSLRKHAARYEKTKDKQEALWHARVIYDLMHTTDENGGSPVVRALAEEIFSGIDPLTRKKVESIPWAVPPTAENAGSVLRDVESAVPFDNVEVTEPDGEIGKWASWQDDGPGQKHDFPLATGNYVFSRLPKNARTEVAAAISDVANSPLGQALDFALSMTHGVMQVSNANIPALLGVQFTIQRSTGDGFFHSIGLSSELLSPPPSYKYEGWTVSRELTGKEKFTAPHRQKMRLVIAHESGHILDQLAAAKEFEFASDNPNSPLSINFEYGPKGIQNVNYGTIADEAVEAYMRGDKNTRQMLEYVFGDLITWLSTVGLVSEKTTAAQMQEGARAARHASVELLPRLIEMYYGLGEQRMRELLPQAATMLSHINHLGLDQIAEVLNGQTTSLQALGRAVSSPKRAVSNPVRVSAENRTAPAAERVRSGNQGVAEGREAGRQPAARGAEPRANVGLTAAQQQELDAWGMPAPTEYNQMARAWNGLKAAVTDWRNRPWTLGWMTMRQIQDRFGSKDPKNPTAIDTFVNTYLRMGRRAEEIANELNNVLKPWRNLPTEVQRRLGILMIESSIEQIHPDVEFTDEANAYLRTGTEEQQAENRARYDRLRSKYVAFTSQFPRAGEIYKQAKAANQKLWQMMYEARADDIMRVYKEDLKEYFSEDELKKIVRSKQERTKALESIKPKGMSYNDARALRNLIEAADTNYKEFAKMQGPYFPLTRHGNHVVVAKSAAMKNAIANFKELNDALQKLYDMKTPAAEDARVELDEAIEQAKELVGEARGKIEKMKASEQHYSVTFFESDWEAQAYAKELQKHPSTAKYGLQVGVEQRAEHYQQFDGASPQFIRRLEEQLKSTMPKAEWAGVRNAVREIYMRAAPDRSALKGELRRLNVPGAKATEMLRGFAQRGMGNAFRISRMEYGGQLHDALNALKQADKRDDIILGNEMAKRLMHSFTAHQSNAIIDGLAQMTHMTYLGLSPAYTLVNASQPWVISLPIMAARHGFGRSGAALANASGEVMQVIKAMRKTEYDKLKTDEQRLAWIKSFRFSIQPEKLGKTDAEIAMLKELFNDGLIDITVEHDLGAVSSGESRNWLTVASEISATPAHVIEIINRVATSLAAFRLERQRNTPLDTATDYARSVVADTHLDYSAENAPRFMRADSFGGLGRLIFQFRKFQQGMLYLNYKLLMDSLKGDKEARRGLTYLMGMQVGVAGVAGIPLAGGVRLLVNAIENLWDDDDEPDLQEMFYNGLKDSVGEAAARALMKGIPAALGFDLSKRIGLGELTDPLRFASLEGKSGKELVMATAFGVFGPSGSMLANWADAAATAATDPLKAAQLATPKVMADVLRAIERTDRGLQTRGGDQLIAKEEFTPLDIALKGMGFESTKVTDLYDTRSAINRAKAAQNDARNALIKEYVQAKQEGKTTGEVMDRITAFNRRNPGDKITMQTLEQSRKSREKATREMVGGARVGKRDRDVLDQVGLR